MPSLLDRASNAQDDAQEYASNARATMPANNPSNLRDRIDTQSARGAYQQPTVASEANRSRSVAARGVDKSYTEPNSSGSNLKNKTNYSPEAKVNATRLGDRVRTGTPAIDQWTGKAAKSPLKGIHLPSASTLAKGIGGLGLASAAYGVADNIANSDKNLVDAMNQPVSLGSIPDMLMSGATNQLVSQPLSRLGLLEPLQNGMNAINTGASNAFDAIKDNVSQSQVAQYLGGLFPEEQAVQEQKAPSMTQEEYEQLVNQPVTGKPAADDNYNQYTDIDQIKKLAVPSDAQQGQSYSQSPSLGQPVDNRPLNMFGEPIQTLGQNGTYMQGDTEVLDWGSNAGNPSMNALAHAMPKDQYIDYAGQARVAYDDKGKPYSIPSRVNPDLSHESKVNQQRGYDQTQQQLGINQQNADTLNYKARNPTPKARYNKYKDDGLGGLTAVEGPEADRAFAEKKGKANELRQSLYSQAIKKNPNMTMDQFNGYFAKYQQKIGG